MASHGTPDIARSLYYKTKCTAQKQGKKRKEQSREFPVSVGI